MISRDLLSLVPDCIGLKASYGKIGRNCVGKDKTLTSSTVLSALHLNLGTIWAVLQIE